MAWPTAAWCRAWAGNTTSSPWRMPCPARARCCACAPRASRTAACAPTSSPATGTPRFRGTCATSRSPNTASPTCAAAPMRECVAAMIDIADSRFQEELLGAAKRANKIDAGYRMPEPYRHNTPAAARGSLRGAAARGAVLRISLRHGPHARGDRTRARTALAEGAHRERGARLRRLRARLPAAWMLRIALSRKTGLGGARGLPRKNSWRNWWAWHCAPPRRRAPRYFANSRDGSLNALNSSALPEGS